MVKRVRFSDGSNMKMAYTFVVIMYMFVFQQLIQKFVPVFKYADELFSCLAFVAIVLDMANRRRMGKGNVVTMVCMGVVALCGFWSSWLYQFQPLNIVLSDFIVVLKFFLTMYAGERLFADSINGERARRVIKYNCILIIYIILILIVLDFIFDLFPASERYGLRAIRLFYEHQTYLVAIGVFLMSVYIVSAQKRIRFSVVIVLCIVMSLTLRAKAFGMSMAAIAMYIFTVKLNKKLNIIYLILLAVGIYMLVGDRIEMYYGNGGDLLARTVLNETSLRIAEDFFPFGTGFGTFGSYYSGVEYSPIYSLYKISNVWGLSPDMKDYIADTFWPMILGQFGVIGAVAYAGAVGIIFLKVQRLARGNRYLYYGAISAFIYLMISSTAESAFVNSMAVPLGWIIGVTLSDKSYLSAPKKQAFIKTMKMRKFYKK